MVDPKSIFHGVPAKTGRALHPTRTMKALVELAQRKAESPSQTGPFAVTGLGVSGARRHLPLLFDDVDLSDLSDAGWGVVFSAKADPALHEALKPLLDH